MANVHNAIKNDLQSVSEMQLKMDVKADEAEKELAGITTIKQFQDWWKKWYLDAGHKRLGRILIEYEFK
jgi:hypothetical protein